jgi:hypothetical protein
MGDDGGGDDAPLFSFVSPSASPAVSSSSSSPATTAQVTTSRTPPLSPARPIRVVLTAQQNGDVMVSGDTYTIKDELKMHTGARWFGREKAWKVQRGRRENLAALVGVDPASLPQGAGRSVALKIDPSSGTPSSPSSQVSAAGSGVVRAASASVAAPPPRVLSQPTQAETKALLSATERVASAQAAFREKVIAAKAQPTLVATLSAPVADTRPANEPQKRSGTEVLSTSSDRGPKNKRAKLSQGSSVTPGMFGVRKERDDRSNSASASAGQKDLAHELAAATIAAKQSLIWMKSAWENTFERNVADLPAAVVRREAALVSRLRADIDTAEATMHAVIASRVSTTLGPTMRARAALVFAVEQTQASSSSGPAIGWLAWDTVKIIAGHLLQPLEFKSIPSVPVARFSFPSSNATGALVIPGSERQPRGTYLFKGDPTLFGPEETTWREVDADGGAILCAFALKCKDYGTVLDMCVLDSNFIALVTTTGFVYLLDLEIIRAEYHRENGTSAHGATTRIEALTPDVARKVALLSEGTFPRAIAFDPRSSELYVALGDKQDRNLFRGFEIFTASTEVSATGRQVIAVHNISTYADIGQDLVPDYEDGWYDAKIAGLDAAATKAFNNSAQYRGEAVLSGLVDYRRREAQQSQLEKLFGGSSGFGSNQLHVDTANNRLLLLQTAAIWEFPLPGFPNLPFRDDDHRLPVTIDLRGRPTYAIQRVGVGTAADLALVTCPTARSFAVDSAGNIVVSFCAPDSGMIRAFKVDASELGGRLSIPRKGARKLFVVRSHQRDTDLKLQSLGGLAVDRRRGRILVCAPNGLMMFGPRAEE